MGELREALRQGRLCLLVDAINEAASTTPGECTNGATSPPGCLAGNHLIFSCRTLDYAGEMAVQQVEDRPAHPVTD